MTVDAGTVFVPGGYPKYTYNPRSNLGLERKFQEYLASRHKLLTVTGMTKCGKTVLANTMVPKDRSIWVPGGSVESLDDFWGFVNSRLGTVSGVDDARTDGEQGLVQGAAETQLGFPQVGLGAKASAGGSRGRSSARTVTYRRSASPKITALEELHKNQIPVVIDDFHHIPKAVQGQVVRNLKALIFGGLPVVLLAVPHRRFDAVRVEDEMTGRIEHITIEGWSPAELAEIPRKGFPLLNVAVAEAMLRRLQPECFGSPHLMQEFCLRLCRSAGITTPAREQRTLGEPPDWGAFFHTIAADMAKATFDRLAKGPERTTRIKRHLKNGRTVDIYQAVLLSIAKAGARPEMGWDTIRAGLREIIAEPEQVPRSHEVTRVLEQMAKIAKENENVRPVMEWDAKMLHIFDPFFSFYLKWGIEMPV